MNLLLHLPQILAQADLAEPADHTTQLSPEAAAGLGIAGLFIGVIYLILVVLFIAGVWKVLVEGRQPGWASLVPIYNVIALWQMTGKPTWVIVLTLIPCTTAVGWIILNIHIAERFGKGAGFGIGLALLPFIFYPMLGFGSAQYLGPAPAIPTATV
jgi:hypothetical protein